MPYFFFSPRLIYLKVRIREKQERILIFLPVLLPTKGWPESGLCQKDSYQGLPHGYGILDTHGTSSAAFPRALKGAKLEGK